MRIISKFHDYYDVVQKYGQDSSVVYIREQDIIMLTEEDKKLSQIHNDFANSASSRGLDLSTIVLGFCGKIYAAILIKYRWTEGHFAKEKTSYCYNIDQVKSFVRAVGNKKLTDRMNKINSGEYFYKSGNYTSIEKFFKKHKTITYSHLFAKYNTPVFTYSEGSRLKKPAILTNSCLKQLEFYKVIDPYTAYQEISMYISGVLGIGAPKTIDISDKDMMYKKGFNDISFKAEKGDKKPRKSNRGKK